MCGICGWVSERRGEDGPGQGVLDRMTDTLSHRGPDDRGTWAADGAWLGHRRLAIIDPSPAGRQPLVRDGVAVVLNGEIYNYQALRDALRAEGSVFDTGTDTEVLLRGYRVWGLDELLERMDGMFAFALWDAGARRLALARDRMGEKPLFWAPLADRSVVFGSELRAVLAHPSIARELDFVALRKYLAYDYVPAPRSMIQGVQKLQPGHAVVWERGAIVREEPYWRMPRPAAGRGGRVRGAEAAQDLWQAIRAGVESRLVSDVPVGLFLSGGLDSTAVAVAAAELRPASTLPTFCVGFDDPSFDESEHAATVANHLGTKHHTSRLTAAKLCALVPEIVARLDEPLADPSLVPTTLLAEFTSGHVKVALGGDGGDELWLGYPTFAAHRPAQLAARLPSRLRRAVLEPAIRALPVSERNWSLDYRLKRFVHGLRYPALERHFVWIGGTAPDEHAGLLEPAANAAAGAASPFDDVGRLLQDWDESASDLDTLSYLYARLYLAEGVLQKVDRATMAHGLESRAPLLAPEMVSAAARVPPELKLRGGETKWLLRQALRGRVPEHIVKRPKKGFGMPLTSWLKGPLLPAVREAIDPTVLRRQAVFKAESCERLVAEHLAGWRDHKKPLWALLVFQAWWRSLE